MALNRKMNTFIEMLTQLKSGNIPLPGILVTSPRASHDSTRVKKVKWLDQEEDQTPRGQSESLTTMPRSNIQTLGELQRDEKVSFENKEAESPERETSISEGRKPRKPKDFFNEKSRPNSLEDKHCSIKID